jgi:murein peptide amidase A
MSVIGHSAEGRAIRAYTLGNGTSNVAIVGGLHGAPEANSADLVWQVLQYYAGDTEAIPSDLKLLFLPEANPDGLADGTRELADGIDANRNWPTADWSPTSYGPGGELFPGGGGDQPLSEPETIALAEWIDRDKPVAVLSYHSAGGFVMGGPTALGEGLVDAYVNQTQPYAYRDWAFYPVTGDFAQWCEEQGIPVVEVELWDHVNADFDRNLAGVQAVLDTLESIVSGNRPY